MKTATKIWRRVRAKARSTEETVMRAAAKPGEARAIGVVVKAMRVMETATAVVAAVKTTAEAAASARRAVGAVAGALRAAENACRGVTMKATTDDTTTLMKKKARRYAATHLR